MFSKPYEDPELDSACLIEMPESKEEDDAKHSAELRDKEELSGTDTLLWRHCLVKPEYIQERRHGKKDGGHIMPDIWTRIFYRQVSCREEHISTKQYWSKNSEPFCKSSEEP